MLVEILTYRKPARLVKPSGPQPISPMGAGRGGVLTSFTEGQQK